MGAKHAERRARIRTSAGVSGGDWSAGGPGQIWGVAGAGNRGS